MRRARRNPLLEHPSLVQSLSAARPNARGGNGPRKLVLVRCFDDGKPVVKAVPDTQADNPGAGQEYDVSSANPDFDPSPYEAEVDSGSPASPGKGKDKPPSIPGEREPQPTPDAPEDQLVRPGDDRPDPRTPDVGAARPGGPSKAPASRDADPTPDTSAAKSYARRAVKQLVKDEELKADIEAILGGTIPPSQGAPAMPVPMSQPAPSSRPDAPHESTADATQASPTSLDEISNEHEIFDRIAANMRYASAYDLGSVALQQRFDRFDRAAGVKPPLARQQDEPRAPGPTPPAAGPAPTPAPPGPAAAPDPATLEPEPATTTPGPTVTEPVELRPYTLDEKRATFGAFDHEPDPATFGGDGVRILGSWVKDNIEAVPIPQLAGRTAAGKPITKGVIHFHRQGKQALIDLWKDWEAAGLLDRVFTYDGGFAARYIRGTRDRDPRPLSNHAYGTAFDINAQWNPFGQPPAAEGEKGSVRELVEIANRHGFYWGGDYRTRPDGMHFELGKPVRDPGGSK